MSATLQKKLVRDLLRLRGQVVTIALVIAGGIAAFVAMRGNFASLREAEERFYARRGFADIFVALESAPVSLARDMEAIPGVSRVDVRVAKPIILPLPQVAQPVRGRVLSLPADEPAALNQLQILQGRRPEPGHSDEVVLLESFARAQRIAVGDWIPVLINGRQRDLRVVGLGGSPEFIIPIQPGSMSADADRFAVVWMERPALATAFRMEGAFNDAILALQQHASEPAVIAAIDRLLERYGGFGAYARARQASHLMVEQELLQLKSLATTLPMLFLAVAVLLVHIVLSRLVLLQQSDIATLKAIGYSDLQVGWHFLELALAISLIGVGLGVGAGTWLGAQMVHLYSRFFQFPDLHFRLSWDDALIAIAVSLLASAGGAYSAVRKVVSMPPAEAMRPPAPARYRRSILDLLRLGRLLGPSAQMVVRELERRPFRALLSSVAIATATALTVIGGWYYDGIEALLQVQFHEVMREDISISLLHTQPARAARELAHLPGVLAAEGVRAAPVRFVSGHRRREGVIWGYGADAQMRTLRDKHGHSMALPPSGIVLTDMLARVLDVRVGEMVDIELQAGDRRRVRVVLTGLVDEAFGLAGHMRAEALAELLHEPDVINVVLLRNDPNLDDTLTARLKAIPGIASVDSRKSVLRRFREQSGSMILVSALVMALFAAIITVGVVYNNARVALSMRGRDLASLRVLGLTRGEVSTVLLAELALQVVVALPPGLVFGRFLVEALASTTDVEQYRMPIVLTPKSYAFAVLVTLLASLTSALLVRRRVDRLDLIEVLKTRE